MRTLIAFALMVCTVLCVPTAAWASRPSYGGGSHSGSHGGHYSGGRGSSHKDGKYKNRKTDDQYGRHKK